MSTTALSNPYKFRAYRSTGSTPGSAVIVFNTEDFDTNSNYNNTTGEYTVPVTGFYMFGALLTFNQTTTSGRAQGAAIVKNGTIIADNVFVVTFNGGTYPEASMVNYMGQFTANDVITVKDSQVSGMALVPQTGSTFFHGYLISKT